MAIDRADQLRASSTLTGIDFIQVAPSQTELLVFLQHDVLPAAVDSALSALAASDIHIRGEGQVDPPVVKVLLNTSPLPPPVDGRAVLRLVVERPGGFGRYRLELDSTAIDPYFNDVLFSFNRFRQVSPQKTNFDIVKEAGGPRRAVVKEFRGVRVNDELRLSFDPNGKRPAVLCGVEVVAE